MDAKIISVIALLISILVPVCQAIFNKKINNINLEAEYFDIIYKDYLVYKIPEARLKLEVLDNGIVNGIDNFLKILREMRKKSLYFKFSNEEFYNEILGTIQKLEDKLVMINVILDVEQFSTFLLDIESTICDIYDTILSATHGDY